VKVLIGYAAINTCKSDYHSLTTFSNVLTQLAFLPVTCVRALY